VRRFMLAAALSLLVPWSAAAQSASADSYSRYELLAPETASFKIVYDVTATTAGARYYFNPIRKGSQASDESVIDRFTGKPLTFEVVNGEQALADGQRGADLGTDYLRIRLARPVPEGGEARLRILKTYKDPRSYYTEGDLIVFDRSLGIRRNAVVLPPGYEVVSCNFPSQVIQEADGRLAISHLNNTPSPAPLVIKARRLPSAAVAQDAVPSGSGRATSATRPAMPASREVNSAPADELHGLRIRERAVQDREIVYFLKQPETHAFSLYHDYTESRPGIDKYLNVVRAGSAVSEPAAVILDTGETLATEILRGEEIRKAGLDVRDVGTVTADTEVVVIRFPPVEADRSVRLRISETYTDPARYGIVDDRLVWHRSFGRPSNHVVLPEGWSLTDSSIPAVIRTEPDGRTRLEFVNPRPDSIDVILKARRRR